MKHTSRMKLCEKRDFGITPTARDVAAAPQTPQLGGAQANFGGPSLSEIAFWLRDYFQFSRLVYNRFKL